MSSLCVNFRRSCASLWSPTCFDIIELKFCIWLCFTVLQIKFECRQFLLELCPFWNTQFSALFSCTLWHIELKFCIWLCFAVLQIKFECRQFLSIFVGVMPLLELRILEIQFSAFFSYIELKFYIRLCVMFYRSSSSVIILCPSGSPSVHPFPALSSYMHQHI